MGEQDLALWVGRFMSLLITISPVPLFRLLMQLVCPFFKFAVVGLFPQLGLAWEGLEKYLRAERADRVIAMNWRGHSPQGGSHMMF